MAIKSALWAILLAHLPRAALAGVIFTNEDYYIEAGIPFTITWTNNRGAVTVTLMNGPDMDLQPVLVIVSDYEGQEYTWTPPTTLATDSYELQITDSGSADYSPRFRFTGVPGGSDSGSTGTLTTSSTPSSISPSQPPNAVPTTETTTNPTLSNPAITNNNNSSNSNDGQDTPATDTAHALSTPAKVAIATVSSLLFLALLALLLIWLVARKRRKERDILLLQQQQQQQLQPHQQQYKPFAADDSLVLTKEMAAGYMDGTGPVARVIELPVGNESIEIEGVGKDPSEGGGAGGGGGWGMAGYYFGGGIAAGGGLRWEGGEGKAAVDGAGSDGFVGGGASAAAAAAAAAAAGVGAGGGGGGNTENGYGGDVGSRGDWRPEGDLVAGRGLERDWEGGKKNGEWAAVELPGTFGSGR
ncbi:hypothetical protein MFIFM68171_02871 [Madurella fahalii]|uniref:Yeast cell wall synthesis Kre9/Knh1-like N-terminal domain-containing protein n=1 Tax=Madurella fahalii TaxID=1157608 RepID=A0ABQ0G4G7_9PEZI